MSAAGLLHDVLMPPFTNLSPGERLLSAFLGVAMVTAALPRSRWAPVAAGAALLLRAGSGYCPLTHALGGSAAASIRLLSGRRGTHGTAQATIAQPASRPRPRYGR